MKKLILSSILVVTFVAGRFSWQVPLCVNAQQNEPGITCADANGDGTVDLSDPIYILFWLFAEGPAPHCPSCLPGTGQTTCYDLAGNEIDCDSTACPGQDGFYLAGCATEDRFVDNDDGTVTDNCTGLVWQKDTADLDGDEQVGSGDAANWREALVYCDGLKLGGHEDWRLPNIRELLSIVDYSRGGDGVPVIDPVFGVENSRYWSSTTVAQDPSDGTTPDMAWFVFFGAGGAAAHGKGTAYFVRAVRGWVGNG